MLQSVESFEWVETYRRSPNPNTAVLIAYRKGAFYIGYFVEVNSDLTDLLQRDWKAYGAGGLQDIPPPDFWSYVPGLPK